MSLLFESAKRIRSISSNLPMESEKREQIRVTALEVARDYLNSLSADEERFPEEVALSAVYISCKLSSENLSQSLISTYSPARLNGWPCIVEDMLNRRNIPK